MDSMPEIQHSRAVVIGTSHYRTLDSLFPAVHNNVVALVHALCDQAIWGLPAAHCMAVEDPDTPSEMLDAAAQVAGEATDTLVLYYAGHGLVDSRRGELHLCLTGSDAKRPYTAVPYEHIRDLLLASRARRKIVILDCCYSGRALGQMGDTLEAIANEASAEGTYILAAAAENKPALAPPGETYTAFTSELLQILECGLPSQEEYLSLDMIYNHILGEMRSKMRPLPQKRDRNTAGQLRFVRNRSAEAAAGDDNPAPISPTFPEVGHQFGSLAVTEQELNADLDEHIKDLSKPHPSRTSGSAALGRTATHDSVDDEIDSHIQSLIQEKQ